MRMARGGAGHGRRMLSGGAAYGRWMARAVGGHGRRWRVSNTLARTSAEAQVADRPVENDVRSKMIHSKYKKDETFSGCQHDIFVFSLRPVQRTHSIINI